MSRVGLTRDQITTHVDGLVELHFNLIRDDILASESLREALKELCVTNNVVSLIVRGEASLSRADSEAFNLILSLFTTPQETFRVLRLNDADVPEINYAMQRKLLLCLGTIAKREERDWFDAAKQTLQRRYFSLPTWSVIVPDYNMAAEHAYKMLLGAMLLLLGIRIIYRFSDVYSLKSETTTDGILKIGALIYGAIYLPCRLLPLLRGHATSFVGNTSNLFSALSERSFPREIQAAPPGNSWDEVLDQARGQAESALRCRRR